jgi:hypothetical protein
MRRRGFPGDCDPSEDLLHGPLEMPGLLARVLNCGALASFLGRSNVQQASDLSAALRIVGPRLHAEPWGRAVLHAIRDLKCPALKELLSQCPHLELPQLQRDDWNKATQSLDVFRTLVQDSRVDPFEPNCRVISSVATSNNLLAVLLGSPRVNGDVVARVLQRVHSVLSVLGSGYGWDAPPKVKDQIAEMQASLRAVVASPYFCPAELGARALRAAAAYCDTATVKAVVERCADIPNAVFADAVCSAAARIGAEWIGSPVFSVRCSDTGHAFGVAPYDDGVLELLLDSRPSSAASVAVAIMAAARLSNRTAVLRLLQAVGARLQCLVRPAALCSQQSLVFPRCISRTTQSIAGMGMSASGSRRCEMRRRSPRQLNGPKTPPPSPPC